MKHSSMAWVVGLALVVGAACGDGAGADAARDAATAERPAAAQHGETAAESGRSTAESGVVYVDVRTRSEYDAGHVAGAIHIPHTEMAQRYSELEAFADREIVVYCRSGRRSGIAQSVLERQGFDNVTNGGGLRDLRAQGVPTTP